MIKVKQIHPKHKHLLNNHTSGYWWVRPTKQSEKYKGKIIFSEDFGKTLRGAWVSKANKRMLYPWFEFKLIGYVFGNVDFISLMLSKKNNPDLYMRAYELRNELIAVERKKNKQDGIKNAMKKKFGIDDYTGSKRIIKNPGSIGERNVWVWSFKNESLGKEYTHIFSFSDDGVQIGKGRHEFAEHFDLSYSRLAELGAGRISAHKGWTLIGKPRKITHREAIRWKIKLVSKGSKY